jgi:hypothetical protein
MISPDEAKRRVTILGPVQDKLRKTPKNRDPRKVIRELLRRFPKIPEQAALKLLREAWNPAASDEDLKRAFRSVSFKPKMTKAALAEKLHFSERHISTLINGTPSRELAERIAELRGGTVEDYWKPSTRARGRPRPFIFREFAKQEADEIEGSSEPSEADMVIQSLDAMYSGHPVENERRPVPPADFESLELLISFARNAGLSEKVRSVLDVVWRRFRVWREQPV